MKRPTSPIAAATPGVEGAGEWQGCPKRQRRGCAAQFNHQGHQGHEEAELPAGDRLPRRTGIEGGALGLPAAGEVQGARVGAQTKRAEQREPLRPKWRPREGTLGDFVDQNLTLSPANSWVPFS